MVKWLVAFLLIMANALCAVAQPWATGPHIRVELLSEHSSLKPGQQNWLGIYLQPEQHWHTYWLNPGDSGEPPKVNWSVKINGEEDLQQRVEFGAIHWPVPQRIPVAHLVNFGYEQNNLLMVPVTLDNSLQSQDQVQILADVSWLVCKEDCIPGWATLTLPLMVSELLSPSKHAALFETTRQSWPQERILEAGYEVTEEHITLALDDVEQLPDSFIEQSFLFPVRADLIKHNAGQQQINLQSEYSFILEKSEYFIESSEPARFLLSDGETGFWLEATLNFAPEAVDNNDVSLVLMVLFAFAGGLILNLMPCVLPVLAIKGMSLHRQPESGLVKFAYLTGVLLSFLVFALAILVMKQAGENIGWGFHMQEPLVIMLLAVLFTYIMLMLMDIAPGGESLMGLGQGLNGKNQFQQQFFTGVLAVLVASPCTAPFMGVAMGAAMISPPLHTVLIFLSLGLGFALPLTLMHLNPGLAKYLPKPGAWMDTFKQFLVFPLLGTLLWLLWVFAGQAGIQAQLLLGFCLLLMTLTFWSHKKNLTILYILSALLTCALFWFAIPDSARQIESQTAAETAWSEQRLSQLRSENQVVLVNMTADWCITCKVNEQVAFQDSAVQQILRQKNVHYLVGDWTNKNADILQYLNRYQRVGVPLYVLYAGTEYQQVLPQILTTQIVKTAIQEAQEAL